MVRRRMASLSALALVCTAASLPVSAQMPWNPVDLRLSVSKRVLFPTDTETTLMVDVAGLEGETQRAPVAMGIVIDTSGSMEGQKIQDARSAAHALVDRLADGDLLTLVTYADAASVLLSNVVVGADRTAAHAAIERIQATGSTCISCGLEDAYRLLAVTAGEFNIRTVLLSDGNANRGTADAQGLRNLASAALEGRGIPTSTIGLGFDYNEDLMTAVANGGSGAYYFLADSDAIATILDREFDQLGTVVAGNVTIELTPVNGVTFGHTTAPNSQQVGNTLRINLGQLSSGTNRQILVPVNVPSGVDLGDVVSVRATYTYADGQNGALEDTVALERSEDSTEVALGRDARVEERAQQVQAARVTEAALEAYHRGDREGARQQLQSNLDNLRVQGDALGSQVLFDEMETVGGLIEYLDSSEPSEQEVEGLERHNRARRMEVESGAAPAEMYHDEATY